MARPHAHHDHDGHDHGHHHHDGHDHDDHEMELGTCDAPQRPGKPLRLHLPLLLPEVQDEQDACLAHLTTRLAAQRGVQDVHVEQRAQGSVLCLHYDPNHVTLQQLERGARDAGARISKQYRHETVWLQGMDCGDCATSLEHILKRVPGIVSVRANYAAERLLLEYDTKQTSGKELRALVRRLGYEPADIEDGHAGHDHDHAHGAGGLLLPLIAGAALAIGFFGETFFGLPSRIALALYVLAYVTGGWDATRHGVKALLKFRFDIDLLMVAAAAGAAILGHWEEGALLLFLFSLGHALEHMALDRARHAISALGQLAPKTARVRREGREVEVGVKELLRGDVVLVRPGERIPIDGRVAKGMSAVDQSPITGESVPVEKTPESEVFAGTINGEGALEIVVTKLAKDTTLSRVVQMVEEAQTQKSPTQRFTERFERVFVPLVLTGVVLVILLPPLIGALAPTAPLLGRLALPWQESFLRAMTILVAASPCALAISTPAAVLSGIAQAARHGVLIKGGVHLENLGRVRAIAFDKTGTLTRGKPEVTDVLPLGSVKRKDLLVTAASVEARSHHPLAQAVVRLAQTEGLALLDVQEAKATTGRGIIGNLGSEPVEIGSLRLFELLKAPVPAKVEQEVRRLEAEGKTTMLVRRNGAYMGILALADAPREEAPRVIGHLERLGVKEVVMLTGDNKRVALAVAKNLGVRTHKAELLPEDKVVAIRDLTQRHGVVAMVGDGVNDAPAMANATIGIAMGAGGTDVALETADVALMADNLGRLPFAVGLSRKSRGIIQQNLFISLGVILLLVPTALLGVAGIGIAIVFHEGSTLLVVLNALRLLNYKEGL